MGEATHRYRTAKLSPEKILRRALVFDVNRSFSIFESRLRMSPAVVEKLRLRYHEITRRINHDFWGINSDALHSRYAGSYGRGTAISTSDIDIHVELPYEIYKTYWFSNRLGRNTPSELLQRVKTSLKKTYPKTDLRGDGQVVVVDFFDGIRFEVVPVFEDGAGEYAYPDTHNGGSWPRMSPRVEADAFADLSRRRPGGLKKLCRMLREANKTCSLSLQGQAIDAMCYEYWSQCSFADNKPFLYFDWHTRDFFAYWADQFSRGGWVEAPGTRRKIEVQVSKPLIDIFACLSKAASTASNTNQDASEFWRLIYGDRFPKQ